MYAIDNPAEQSQSSVTALCALTVLRFHTEQESASGTIATPPAAAPTVLLGENTVTNNLGKTNGTIKPIATLGSFVVGNSEFAIDIEYIQEVVNHPGQLDSLPNATSFLRGIFNLRGNVIPVIDMQDILCTQAATNNTHNETAIQDTKIVIVRYNGASAGLMVNATKEILKIRAEDRTTLHYATTNNINILKSVLKPSDSTRLVQEIDISALYALAHIATGSDALLSGNNTGRHKGAMSKCILFRVGESNVVIDIKELYGIRDVEEIRSSEIRSPLCAGMIAFRGVNAPVLKLESFIAGYTGSSNNSSEKRVLVLGNEDGYMGIMIDAVESINSYYADDLVPNSNFAEQEGTIYRGCLNLHDGTQTLMLDSNSMFRFTPMRELVVAFRNLYRQEYTQSNQRNEIVQRTTYLVFRTAGVTTGMDVQYVKEILNYDILLHPAPGNPPYIHGLLRHRNQLIRVVDIQAFYGIGGGEDTTTAEKKIIVIEHEGSALGIIVDSLETSVTVLNNNKTVLPFIMNQNSEKFTRLSNDIKEMVQVKSEHEGSVAFVELNISSFLNSLKAQLCSGTAAMAA